jgi:uncharacterized membrane protein YqjE
MPIGERSISDVLQDIVGNVQDIVRSEVKLAKSEVTTELVKVKTAAPMLIVGGVTALLATLFLMWAAVYALAIVLPMWAAALIVTALLAVIGSVTLAAGIKTLRRVNPPERTIASMKENVQWAKQQVR